MDSQFVFELWDKDALDTADHLGGNFKSIRHSLSMLKLPNCYQLAMPLVPFPYYLMIHICCFINFVHEFHLGAVFSLRDLSRLNIAQQQTPLRLTLFDKKGNTNR